MAEMTEDLCEHDMAPAYCALCRSLPSGVAARGYRTKGGNAYHNDSRCAWLRKGQRFAERRGLDVHDIEPVAWHKLMPGQLAPCEACCTPEWMKRHQHDEGTRSPRSDGVRADRAAAAPALKKGYPRPVRIDLRRLFGSGESTAVVDGLVLEDVHGELQDWTRSRGSAKSR